MPHVIYLSQSDCITFKLAAKSACENISALQQLISVKKDGFTYQNDTDSGNLKRLFRLFFPSVLFTGSTSIWTEVTTHVPEQTSTSHHWPHRNWQKSGRRPWRKPRGKQSRKHEKKKKRRGNEKKKENGNGRERKRLRELL